MPAISRKTQKIFAGGLVPTGNIAKWGSLLAGAPAYSDDPDEIQTAAWLNGLNGALIGNRSPAVEDLNAFMFLVTRQIACIMQSGVPEWDAGTEYFMKQLVRGVGTSILYSSVIDNNTGNSVGDSNYWLPLQDITKGPTMAAAWVEFDGINASGGNAIIHSSFNVSSVLRNGTGSYTINFASSLPSAHYVFAGSCGSEDGQAFGAGDNGLICGNIAGQGNAIHSASQCRVFTIDSATKLPVASGNVSVLFFAR